MGKEIFSVPDCATYFGDDTTNVVFYTDGKSLSEVTTKELGVAPTAHVESIHHQPPKNNIGDCLKVAHIPLTSSILVFFCRILRKV